MRDAIIEGYMKMKKGINKQELEEHSNALRGQLELELKPVSQQIWSDRGKCHIICLVDIVRLRGFSPLRN